MLIVKGEIKMTFEMLAKLVAEDFQKTMDENGFDTFADMKFTYDWEWADIKDEIAYTITAIGNELNEPMYMYDDRTYVQIGIKAIPWREFKKLVFSIVK